MTEGIDVREPSDLRGGVNLLPEKFTQCPNDPECESDAVGMQTHSSCMKTKIFTIPTSNETAIAPEIAIFRAYTINQSINQSVNHTLSTVSIQVKSKTY